MKYEVDINDLSKSELYDLIVIRDNEIERLKKYEKFIDSVIITPVDFNDEDGNYQLHNMEKQELYKILFNLRHTLIHEQWDGKVFKDD